MGDVNYLFEPEGSELHWEGLQKKPEPSVQTASLAGDSNPMVRHGLGGSRPTEASFAAQQPQATEPHKMSPDELLAYAKNMLATQEVSNSHSMAKGPSTGARDDSGSKTPAWLADYMSKPNEETF